MCHPWGASGLDGIQRYVLGLSVIKAQHELIQIKPLDFKGKLLMASGTIPTDKGDLKIEWKYTDKDFTLTVKSPVNVSANVFIPKGKSTGNVISLNGRSLTSKSAGNYWLLENVGSGDHTFILRY